MTQGKLATLASILSLAFLLAQGAWAQKAAAPAKPAAPPAKAAQPAKAPGPELSDAAKHTMELRAALDSLRVTLEVKNVALSDAVRSLSASLSKVNIVLDDALPASVKDRQKTLSLRDVPLRTALTNLAQPDLAFEVVYEAVFISTRSGIADLVATAPIIPEDLAPEGKALVDALKHKRLSFSFENARLPDAVNVLSQLTGVKMTLDPGIPPDKLRDVALSLADVYLESALNYLTGKDLNYAISLGAIFISTNEGVQKEMARRVTVKKRMAEKSKFGVLLASPVTCEFTKTPLNDAVAVLGMLTKARIVFEPNALQTVGSKAMVTARFKNVPMEDALEQILPERLDYTVKEVEKETVIEIAIKGAKRPEKPAPPVKKK